MILEGELGKLFRDIMLQHRGHKLIVTPYGKESIVNVSLECEKCQEVLIDSTVEEGEENELPKL